MTRTGVFMTDAEKAQVKAISKSMKAGSITLPGGTEAKVPPRAGRNADEVFVQKCAATHGLPTENSYVIDEHGEFITA